MMHGLRDGNEMGYVVMVTTNASNITSQKKIQSMWPAQLQTTE